MSKNWKPSRARLLRSARALIFLSEYIIQALPVEVGTEVAAQYLLIARNDLTAISKIAGITAREMHRAKQKGRRP